MFLHIVSFFFFFFCLSSGAILLWIDRRVRGRRRVRCIIQGFRTTKYDSCSVFMLEVVVISIVYLIIVEGHIPSNPFRG